MIVSYPILAARLLKKNIIDLELREVINVTS